MKPMRLFLLVLFVFPFCATAQVVIQAGTEMAVSENTDITMHIASDMINRSSYDFSGVKLNVALNGSASQTLQGNWSIKNLSLAGDGIKTLSGLNSEPSFLTVTERFSFGSGILRVVQGKVLFTGHHDNVETNFSGSSYIDGPFYQRGGGARKYPIGSAGLFAPLQFEGIQTKEEVGIELIASDSRLIQDNLKVIEVDNTRYWQITTSDPAKINSKVTAGVVGNSLIQEGTIVVLQANAINNPATNLGNSGTGAISVTSANKVTAPILALGRINEVKIKIRNLITPFGNDQNDALSIEKLDAFVSNKVTLMDRWGVVVKEWQNYDEKNPGFDFRKLTPGNYICIVECTDDQGVKQSETQMVTVLKTN